MIFLDNNATTPLIPEVKEVMLNYMDTPLNPSSVHSYGREAKYLLFSAKKTFANCLKVLPEEIIFTSGGTESMNMLIKGLYPGHGKILTSTLEHPCVSETISSMNVTPENVLKISPKNHSAPCLSDIKSFLSENISLMVFSAVYSETGDKIALEDLAYLAEMYNIPLVIDGVALLGKEPFQIPEGVTGMGFSAHKLHGPLGVGAAFLRSSAIFKPLIHGGPQQMNKRSGTENILGIIGFAKALEIAYDLFPNSTSHMLDMQSLFLKTLDNLPIKTHINGDGSKVCNTLNIYFEDIDGETLLLALDRQGVAVSMGSACSSGSIEPSKILLNMGYDISRVKSSIRFSWSRLTSLQDIKKALHILNETLRQLKPVLLP